MLKPLNESHLAMILEWRNQPSVRACMYNNHEISPTEHREWFREVVQSGTGSYLLFYMDKTPTGVIQFTEFSERAEHAFWGFYVAPSCPSVTSVMLELEALKFAFETLNLRKLSCEVLSHNKKVLNLHKKTGFSIEGEFKAHHYDGKDHHDVFRLALHVSAWPAARTKLRARLEKVGCSTI